VGWGQGQWPNASSGSTSSALEDAYGGRRSSIVLPPLNLPTSSSRSSSSTASAASTNDATPSAASAAGGNDAGCAHEYAHGAADAESYAGSGLGRDGLAADEGRIATTQQASPHGLKA
jgi:hypothetical protein